MECSFRSSFITGDKLRASTSFAAPTLKNRSSARIVTAIQQSTVSDSHLILGLDQYASKKEIKRAYRNLALQYHPDVCNGRGNEHMFAQINLAYECLVKGSKGQIYEECTDKARTHEVRDEWLSEGFTFEEIFGSSPAIYETVDEAAFQEVVAPGRNRKSKVRKSREDW